MLLTGMGWGKLVPKISEKNLGVGVKPILAGLVRFWPRLSPCPALCDWDFLQQSLAPALVMASGTFLTPANFIINWFMEGPQEAWSLSQSGQEFYAVTCRKLLSM